MTKGPVVIESENVSYAWATAFNELVDAPTHEIVPLVVCMTGFDEGIVREDPRIRALLDAELRVHHMQSIRTVASTIFPSSLLSNWISCSTAAACAGVVTASSCARNFVIF